MAPDYVIADLWHKLMKIAVAHVQRWNIFHYLMTGHI
jgi:hypothetical protein